LLGYKHLTIMIASCECIHTYLLLLYFSGSEVIDAALKTVLRNGIVRCHELFELKCTTGFKLISPYTLRNIPA